MQENVQAEAKYRSFENSQKMSIPICSSLHGVIIW